MGNAVECHAPVQKQKVQRGVCLFEELLKTTNNVDGVPRAPVFAKTKLCGPKVLVYDVGNSGLDDSGVNFVDGRKQRNGSVVAGYAGVAFFVDAGNEGMFPVWRDRCRGPAVV